MKIYQNMPRELVDGWPTRIVSHDSGPPIAFHYHEVEEWLEVSAGEICFVSAGGNEYPLSESKALNIPQGEAHRVQIGPDGVTYTMWLPVEVPEEDFSKQLDAEDISLIEKNLAVPKAEDSEDRMLYRAFFDYFLSEKLTFRTAGGQLLDKKTYLKRGSGAVTRIPSDSVFVLHKSSDSMLLSTVVHTQPNAGGPQQSYSNLRFFVREGGIWRCRVWLNHEERVAS